MMSNEKRTPKPVMRDKSGNPPRTEVKHPTHVTKKSQKHGLYPIIGIAAASTVLLGGSYAAVKAFDQPPAIETPVPPTPTPEPTTIPPTSTPEPTATPTAEELFPGEYAKNVSENIRVFYNKNNIPLGYQYENEIIQFSEEQKSQFEAAKNQAISQHQMTVATAIQLPDIKFRSPAKDRPIYTEAPTDTLSELELKQRGINIVQPESSDVRLHVRKSAFNPGGLLEIISPENPINIILVNEPFLFPDLMKNHPELIPYLDKFEQGHDYDAFRDRMQDPEAYRQQAISRTKQELLDQGSTPSINTLIKIYYLEHATTDQLYLLQLIDISNDIKNDITEKMKAQGKTPKEIAKATYDYNIIAGRHSPKNNTIFLAVGSPPLENDPTASLYFLYTPEGSLYIPDPAQSSFLISDMAPYPYQSAPDPNDLIDDSHPDTNEHGYLVMKRNNPSQALAHELGHDSGIVDETETDKYSLRYLEEASANLAGKAPPEGAEYAFYFQRLDPEGKPVWFLAQNENQSPIEISAASLLGAQIIPLLKNMPRIIDQFHKGVEFIQVDRHDDTPLNIDLRPGKTTQDAIDSLTKFYNLVRDLSQKDKHTLQDFRSVGKALWQIYEQIYAHSSNEKRWYRNPLGKKNNKVFESLGKTLIETFISH